jgi:Rod binding domain-containing protein
MAVPAIGPAQAQPAEGGASPSPKLVKAAHEFEAILLQNWLEKMNHSFPGDNSSLDAAHDTVSSLGTQAIATALAARGGIGIAKMILRQLAGKEPQAETGQVKGSKDSHGSGVPGR